MSAFIEKLSIRPAQASEREALERLQLRASLVWDEYREALLAHPDAIHIPPEQIIQGQVLVACAVKDISGFVALEWRDDGKAELDGLFVEPDQHRHGIGGRLVAAAATMAKTRGCPAMHVVGNPNLRAFYMRCGFVPLRPVPTRFGTALAMEMQFA